MKVTEINRTIAIYNSIVKDYSKQWTDDPRMNEQILKFIELLPKKDKVLDVGCGTGRDVKFFIDQGLDTIGIDLSSAMIEEAKKNVPDGVFIIKNMLKTDFPPETFDGIWACASVLHLPKKYAPHGLLEFYKILKPGGILYLGLQEGLGFKYAKDGRYFAYYEHDEVEKLLADNGFEVLEFASNISHKNTFNEKINIKWLNYWTRKL